MYSLKSNSTLFAGVLVTAIVFTLLGATSLPTYVSAQTSDNNQSSLSEEFDYTAFHSNIEQIIGHIEMAAYNKMNNNDTLTLGHALHPIEEVLTLVTIPINNTDSKLNETYSNNLYQLSQMGAPGNSTAEQFKNQSDSSIELSNQVVMAVVPQDILSDVEHNKSVIRDLLTLSGAEYAEGVQGGQIVMELEHQDGSAFINRAYSLFNETQDSSTATAAETTTTNDSESDTSMIISGFSNLATAVKELKDPAEIDSIIQTINSNLSPTGSSDVTTSEKTPQDYISSIRSLLDQVLTSYESGDIVKAKEQATTAYLDNFEFIERDIGEELSERGESLLREKLGQQINTNVPLEEIKQNIADINMVLDESESILSNNS